MDKQDECPSCKKIVSNYDLHVVQCQRQLQKQSMRRMQPTRLEEEEEEEKEEQQFQKQLKYDKLGDNLKKLDISQSRDVIETQQKRENFDDNEDKDQESQEELLKNQEKVQKGSQQKLDNQQQDGIENSQENTKIVDGNNQNERTNQKENTSNEQNDDIACPNCNKMLTFETLENHIETCEYKEVPCRFCEKSFPQFLLQEHLRVCEKAEHTNRQQSTRRQNSRRRRQPRQEEEEEEEQFLQFGRNHSEGEHELDEGEDELFRMLSQTRRRRYNSRQSRVYQDNQNSQEQQESQSQQREDRAARRQALNNNPFRDSFTNDLDLQDQTFNIIFNGLNFNIFEDQGSRRQSRNPFERLLAGVLLLGNNYDPSNNGGLNKQQMKDFPEHKFHKQEGLNPDQSKCTICMSDYEENDKVKVLDCLHSYHSDCIDVWLKKNSKCPVCKKDMKEFV